jgi:dipeptidase E
MKLIMTGGGNSEHFTEIDNHFIGLLGPSPTLLYIPLAGEKSDWNYGLERIKTVFSTIEFDNIEMCIDLSVLNWSDLAGFSAIYFDGGNTFDLMAKIRNTRTYELLHRFLNHGGVINGDSAGSIVLGSHLATAHIGEAGDENESGVTSYQGLNLIGSWAIHCHYEDSDDTQIKQFSTEYGFPIIALHESSGIYIQNNIVRVIGETKISIFKGNSKQNIMVNESFVLD